MINYDMHIHTEYCGHAPQMTIGAILTEADSLNLETIAITAHIFTPDDLPVLELIKAEVAKIAPACHVIFGVEVDCHGRYSDGRLVTDHLDNIDYVVGALHYVPDFGNYPLSPADNPFTPQQLIERWRSSLLGLLNNPRIHTLAHPGRMIASAIDLDIYFENILDIFTEAAEISAQNKIIWEINELNGSKVAPDYLQHWHKIYEIALNAGIKLIYGSDAHEPKGIATTDFTHSLLSKLPPNCLESPDSLGRIKK